METLQPKQSFFISSPSTPSVSAKALVPRYFTPVRVRDETVSPSMLRSKSTTKVIPSPAVNITDPHTQRRCEIISTFTDFYKKQFNNVEFYYGNKACHEVIVPIISHSARSNFKWRSVSSARKVEHIQEFNSRSPNKALRSIRSKSPILNDEYKTNNLLNLLKVHESKLLRDEDSRSDLFLGNQIDPEYINTLINVPKRMRKRTKIKRNRKIIPCDDQWGMYDLI
jgi:hypothetical protein